MQSDMLNQMVRHASRRCESGRAGAALYSLVLLTTILVSAIGLAGLQLARVRGRELSNGDEMSQARAMAMTALQIASCKIASSASWYTQLSGNWLMRNHPHGQSLLSISIIDPIDGNVSGNDETLLVSGIGQHGQATQKLSMTLKRVAHPKSCLRYAAVAGGNIQANQASLHSSVAVAALGDIQLSSSTIEANTIAGGTILGAGITGSTTTQAPDPQMPDPARVLNHYQLQGTTISYSSLPRWQQTQIIRNPSFESDTNHWYAMTDCNLSRSSTRAISGTWSLRISSRKNREDTVAQDLTLSSLQNGNTIHLAIPVFPTANGTASARLSLQSTGDGTQVFKLPDFPCAKNGFGNYSWVTLEGDLSLRWSGTLTKATLSIDTSFHHDFYLDAATLVDVTYPHNMPVIDHQLISPAVNALGSTNAQGIYVINCGNQDVMIGRSRIVGTLVLVNPGPTSCIKDWVNMEPAVPGLPALLIDGNFKIAMNGNGFSESALGMNMNPANTPYPYHGGAGNSTLIDNYPSLFSGMIYASGSLTITGNAYVCGILVANDAIHLSTAKVTLAYDNCYLHQPPPGFRETLTTLKPVLGSIERVVAPTPAP